MFRLEQRNNLGVKGQRVKGQSKSMQSNILQGFHEKDVMHVVGKI